MVGRGGQIQPDRPVESVCETSADKQAAGKYSKVTNCRHIQTFKDFMRISLLREFI